jgi:Zn-dependent protease with chaperone function
MYPSAYTFGAMTGAAVTSRRTLLAYAGMFALVALAGLAEPGLALTMAPALILLALLTGGVRPGEALIERLCARAMRPVTRRARSAPRPRLALVVRPAGLEIASALAMRPPPSGLAVLS